MGTGNYNHQTARFYTDLGLLTAREDLNIEVAEVFNLLTAKSTERFQKLLVAPTTLLSGMVERIQREAEFAGQGRPARIIAKMNGLVDPEIIRELYAASIAGVEIDLVVRGICCLRPGMLGISEHIRVYQHHRALSRAQPRVLFSQRRRRGDLGGQRRLDEPQSQGGASRWSFRVEDRKLKDRLYKELQLCLSDRVKARLLQSDGSYLRLEPLPGEQVLSFQDALMDIARGVEVEVPGGNKPASDEDSDIRPA